MDAGINEKFCLGHQENGKYHSEHEDYSLLPQDLVCEEKFGKPDWFQAVLCDYIMYSAT